MFLLLLQKKEVPRVLKTNKLLTQNKHLGEYLLVIDRYSLCSDRNALIVPNNKLTSKYLAASGLMVWMSTKASGEATMGTTNTIRTFQCVESSDSAQDALLKAAGRKYIFDLALME